MSDSNSEGLQAAVNAAFPVLHGGEEFRDEPALRATLEVPVRAALVAAGLAEVTAERDRLRSRRCGNFSPKPWRCPVADTERPTWYLLWCRHCHPDSTPMPFDSPEERGKWAAAHTAGTGHDQWRVIDQPKDARG